MEQSWISLPGVFIVDESWEDVKKEEDAYEWFELAEGGTAYPDAPLSDDEPCFALLPERCSP